MKSQFAEYTANRIIGMYQTISYQILEDLFNSIQKFLQEDEEYQVDLKKAYKGNECLSVLKNDFYNINNLSDIKKNEFENLISDIENETYILEEELGLGLIKKDCKTELIKKACPRFYNEYYSN